MLTTHRRTAPALLAVLGAVALTACSAGVTDTGSGSTTTRSTSRGAGSVPSPVQSTSQPAGLPSALPSNLPSDLSSQPSRPASVPSSTPVALPPRFPLPTGARTLTGARTDDEIDARISVTDAGAAYTYWRGALPTRGYRVGRAESFGGAAEIDFTGHGCGAGSQLAIHGSEAEVQCTLS